MPTTIENYDADCFMLTRADGTVFLLWPFSGGWSWVTGTDADEAVLRMENWAEGDEEWENTSTLSFEILLARLLRPQLPKAAIWEATASR